MILAPLVLSLLQVPSAALPANTPSAAAAAPAPHRARRLFFSPMGEPFRSTRRDDDTLADWFQQADRNHDGRLTLEEMQQDAERFFALLDVNHDGEIDPDEITRYEDVIAPEVRTGEHYSLASLEGTDGEGRGAGSSRGGRHHGGEGFSPGIGRINGDPHQGAGRYGLLDLPEPVVAADADFNRGVSLAEFRQAAVQRFLALDLDHRGYLTLTSLETIRPAPPPQSSPGKSRPADESASPHDPGL